MIEGNFSAELRDAFVVALRESKHIIVIAGAGLSAASGIPTFRDGGGLWRSLDATALATPEAFAAKPSLVWEFYHYRRSKVLEAKPNEAHRVIAKLSIPAYRKRVAPSSKSFHLVTQNIDRLSVDALHEELSRSCKQASPDAVRAAHSTIYEIHGCIFDVKCTHCGHSTEVRDKNVCEALGKAEESFHSYDDAGSQNVSIPENELPRCTECGHLARPDVIWFGEKPYHLDAVNSLVYKADMCLVIGTSSTVRPASTYAYRVQKHGGKVAVFNLDPSEKDERADFVFKGPCEEILPSLLAI